MKFEIIPFYFELVKKNEILIKEDYSEESIKLKKINFTCFSAKKKKDIPEDVVMEINDNVVKGVDKIIII